MALEHALLVSLSEQSASGLELSRRFERSIGNFWAATHQQIYRTLARMEGDGWVAVTVVPQQGKPDKKVYAVTSAGAAVLADWLAAPTPVDPVRSTLSVKMRGASWGDREAVLASVTDHLAEHRARLAAYELNEKRTYPDPTVLTGGDLDRWLVLRGGVRTEQAWIDYLTDYLVAHTQETP